MTYITEQTVTDLLGADWFGTGDASLSIKLANAWLSSKRLPKYSEIALVPGDVSYAGALVAKDIANNNMMAGRKEGVIASKSVKAGSVSTSKTYVDGEAGQSISQAEQQALMLIEAYILPMTHNVNARLSRY